MSQDFKQVCCYFSKYISEEDLVYIGSAEITSMKVFKDERSLELGLLCGTLLNNKVIDSVQNSLCSGLDLKKAVLKIKYNTNLFDVDEIETILSPIRLSHTIVNGFFEGVEAELKDNNLNLFLKKGGKDLLEQQEIDKAISQLINEQFSLSLNVTFSETESFDIEKAVAEAVKVKQQAEQKKKEEITILVRLSS